MQLAYAAGIEPHIHAGDVLGDADPNHKAAVERRSFQPEEAQAQSDEK
jgi:hypothetical protein